MNLWINIVLIALAVGCFAALFFFLYKFFPTISSKLLRSFKHKEEREILTSRNLQTYASREENADLVRSNVKYFTNFSTETETDCEMPPAKGLARAMSTDSLNSDSSVMNIETDVVSPCGRLELSFEYDKKSSTLTIRVLRARDIKVPMDDFDQYTCYVEVTFDSQDDRTKTKTKPMEAKSDVEMNEKIQFQLSNVDLWESILHIRFVLEHDSDSALNTVGFADIKLSDAVHDQAVKFWLNLRDSKEEIDNFGEIFLSLSFLPTAERLTIVIAKMAKLKWLDPNNTNREAFVKVHLLKNSKRVSKKKTCMKKHISSHLLNECIIFPLVQEELSSIQLRFTVVEVLADGRYYNIGHVVIGNQTVGQELTHWQQMLSSVRKPISMWHHLIKQRKPKPSTSTNEDNRSINERNTES